MAEKLASNEVTLSPPVDADADGPAEAGASDGSTEGAVDSGGAVGDGVAAAPLHAETMIESDANTGRETVRALKRGLL